MEQKRKTRTWCGFLLLLVLLAVFLIWNLFAGSVQLSASQIGQILLGGGEDLTQQRIIMQIRLPRMVSALILGGALSVSGYLLQTFFHNPIAGPFVLGISSGAKLAVSISHRGIDISCAKGAEVHCPWNGKVEEIYEDDSLGITVRVSHSDGWESRSTNRLTGGPVKAGQRLNAGDLIGYVGETAVAECGDGAHLHFEVRKDGRSVDPAEYVTVTE